MKRLLIIAGTSLTALAVSLAPAAAQAPETSSAIAVTPNPAEPGSTAVAVGTFQLLGVIDPADELSFNVDLTGTGGNGTITSGSTNLAGGTCSVDASTNRAYVCTYPAAVVNVNVGTSFALTAQVAVAPATPSGSSFAVDARASLVTGGVTAPDSTASTVLNIEAQAPTTTAPATTAPATTAPATTAPATTATPTVTDPPATDAPDAGAGGTLPATGNGTTWMTVAAIALLAAGGSAVAVARHNAVD